MANVNPEVDPDSDSRLGLGSENNPKITSSIEPFSEPWVDPYTELEIEYERRKENFLLMLTTSSDYDAGGQVNYIAECISGCEQKIQELILKEKWVESNPFENLDKLTISQIAFLHRHEYLYYLQSLREFKVSLDKAAKKRLAEVQAILCNTGQPLQPSHVLENKLTQDHLIGPRYTKTELAERLAPSVSESHIRDCILNVMKNNLDLNPPYHVPELDDKKVNSKFESEANPPPKLWRWALIRIPTNPKGGRGDSYQLRRIKDTYTKEVQT